MTLQLYVEVLYKYDFTMKAAVGMFRRPLLGLGTRVATARKCFSELLAIQGAVLDVEARSGLEPQTMMVEFRGRWALFHMAS